MAENIQLESPEYKEKESNIDAGADYVISSLVELKEMIRMINVRLEFRERRES
jgi:hypothetical protein